MEVVFKVTNKEKNNEHESNKSVSKESNEEEENFVKKLKRGHEKYKGRFPSKFV